MRKHTRKCFVLVVFVMFLGGCTSSRFGSNEPNKGDPSGAQELFPKETYFESINIYQMLTDAEIDESGLTLDENGTEYFMSVSQAYEWFHERTSGETPEKIKEYRARYQERVIQASNQRCSAFKKRLHKYEGDVNFWLGTATTLFAGAAAVISHEQTARELAAAAGFSSGIRAEFNSSYFRNITIEVVTKGIDARRQAHYASMLQKRNQSLLMYPVEAAIADAVSYHGSCTVIAGLQQAADSIARVTDPGISTLNKTLEQLAQARTLASNISADPLVSPQFPSIEYNSSKLQFEKTKSLDLSKLKAPKKIEGRSLNEEQKAYNESLDGLTNRLSKYRTTHHSFVDSVGAMYSDKIASNLNEFEKKWGELLRDSQTAASLEETNAAKDALRKHHSDAILKIAEYADFRRRGKELEVEFEALVDQMTGSAVP